MHRLDERPTVDVIANVLRGIAFGLLLIVLGNEIRAIDNDLADIGDPE
jgi:hypothetical protein